MLTKGANHIQIMLVHITRGMLMLMLTRRSSLITRQTRRFGIQDIRKAPAGAG